jgi:hypothetical protein
VTDRIPISARTTPDPQAAPRADPADVPFALTPRIAVIRAIAFVVGAASLGTEISAAAG